ncbi:hypothetical protein SAMN02745150_01166 [Brevinema andersonii]|uniref:HTH cro/C1-type domain-containing protein n=1 Tax=Brevinema andersonii TaxID=34097 RepID=A0A1I1ETA7_BREAD|nr:AAA family ATPase [Brevinema andersonii]SFB88113.1 hypothetical protein SAMN02745150_01166 [Brevinema andersonii]
MEQGIRDRIEAIRRYLEETGESQGSLARETGLSRTTISNVLLEKYNASYNDILSRCEDVINRREEKRKLLFQAPEFIENSITKKVAYALSNATSVHIPRITVLYGESGIGKTKSLEEFIKYHPTAVLVKIRPDFIVSSILREIAEPMGVSVQGSNYEITNRIINKLKSTGRVLIFDEAEYLSARSLDIIRRIHDEAQNPVVLVGMPKLYHNLVALRNGFEQIANRMISYNLNQPSVNDLEQIVQVCIPDVSDDVCSAYIECSRGTIRTLLLLMQDMVNYEQDTGRKVTAGAIKNYVKTLH